MTTEMKVFKRRTVLVKRDKKLIVLDIPIEQVSKTIIEAQTMKV